MRKYNLSLRIISSLAMLYLFLASPMTGAWLRDVSPAVYLQFPPVTTQAESSSFSWIAFLAVFLFVTATTWPFWRRMAGRSWGIEPDGRIHSRGNYPWWGWAAAAGLILFWVLAWNRFSWFEPFQRFTFFPLWFCFIILLNALAIRVSGGSLLTLRSRFFTLLFPASAAFWWAFEYLNRFVNNWHYTSTSGLGEWQYFWEASLAFSTVLPAVMSVRYILLQTGVFAREYRDFPAMPWLTSGSLWIITGAASVLALIAVGWIPNLTYPLIWIVPGLFWVAWQRWNGYVNPLLKGASKGNLTLVWASACAALVCGFFWEMWNVHSLAKWTYNVPALDGLHLFEMPLAGYAGYLPFGVICAIVANSLLSTMNSKERMVAEEADPREI